MKENQSTVGISLSLKVSDMTILKHPNLEEKVKYVMWL